jgi:hypothetical protein
MKVLTLLLFALITSISFSQGLENVFVETFYSATAQDTVSELYTFPLKSSSKTYRVYLDLKPGYSLQAVYGSLEHPLKINTSTYFFNHSEHGDVIPNVIPYRTLSKNTVMLDSWLSVGAAGEDSYGVILEEDDTTETVKHKNFLISNKSLLTVKDGLKVAGKVPRPTFFNIDSAALVFGNKSNKKEFSTNNGGWFCLGGAKGLDSLGTNKVLIGQFTTDGDFSFELNVQLGTPTIGVSEKYVAVNPVASDFTHPGLIYESRKNKSKKIKND